DVPKETPQPETQPEAKPEVAAQATAASTDAEAAKDVDTASSPKAEPEKAEPLTASETGKAEKEIETCREETEAESFDDSSDLKKTTQTIESFLAGTEGVKASGNLKVLASCIPVDEGGYLYKKSPATLRMKAWDWRFFVIHGRRLLWWRRQGALRASYGTLKGDTGRRGFIDFALSRARVVPDEKNPTLSTLEAVDGAWKDGSLKDMSDAQRTIEFDCTDSVHTRGQWIAALCKLQA
ncbi:BOI2, partial [Symbiodinium necroappetens]